MVGMVRLSLAETEKKMFVCCNTIALPTKLKIMDYNALNLCFCHQMHQIQPLNQGIIKNFKDFNCRQMLRKIVQTIDADESCIMTGIIQSISVLHAVNFISAAWNDVSKDTIQNYFFCSLTSAALDEPFLGFTVDEVPPTFTQETYMQYVNLLMVLKLQMFMMILMFVQKFYKIKKLKQKTSIKKTLLMQLL